MPLFLCYALWQVNAIDMSWLLTLQDDSGGFDFVGNAFQVKDKDARKLAWKCQRVWRMCISNCLALKNCMSYVSGHAEHRRFWKGADLKQNFFHLVSWNIFQKRNDKCKAASASTTCAVSSWFSVLCAMLCLSWVDKADSDENQNMFNWKLVLLWGDQEGRRTSHCTVEDRNILPRGRAVVCASNFFASCSCVDDLPVRV